MLRSRSAADLVTQVFWGDSAVQSFAIRDAIGEDYDHGSRVVGYDAACECLAFLYAGA